MRKYVENSRKHGSLGGEEYFVGGSRKSKLVDRTSFEQMEFEGDPVSEVEVSHKFDQECEEVASDITCGVTSEGEQVAQDGDDNKLFYNPFELEGEEVRGDNGDRSEGCTTR